MFKVENAPCIRTLQWSNNPLTLTGFYTKSEDVMIDMCGSLEVFVNLHSTEKNSFPNMVAS